LGTYIIVFKYAGIYLGFGEHYLFLKWGKIIWRSNWAELVPWWVQGCALVWEPVGRGRILASKGKFKIAIYSQEKKYLDSGLAMLNTLIVLKILTKVFYFMRNIV